MNRRDNIMLSILSMIGLWVVIIFLSSAIVRLFYAIIRTFIYLVGLVSVLLMVCIIVAIFSYIIYIVIKKFTNCQRSIVDKLKLLHFIIHIQLKAILGLVFIYLTLGIIYILVI